jgi:hypothetical protein
MQTTIGKQNHQHYATGAYSSKGFARIGTEMNDDTFARIVADEVKNKATLSQREYLEMPANRERWKRALSALIDNLDDQISDLLDDEDADRERYERMGSSGAALLAEAIATYSSRRHKVERFKHYVQAKLERVQAMPETAEFVSRSEMFEKAILQHKRLMEEFDMEPSAADEALWATLDGKWEFDGITM